MNTDYFQRAVTKHLTVFSNDPDRPQVELTDHRALAAAGEDQPEPAALLAVGDKAVTQEFTLERSGGTPDEDHAGDPQRSVHQSRNDPAPGRGPV